ncbi:9289_t:CDS:2, partial [Funneliformis geosporum]
ALVCLALYAYGSHLNQDYTSGLPVLGGLAFEATTGQKIPQLGGTMAE